MIFWIENFDLNWNSCWLHHQYLSCLLSWMVWRDSLDVFETSFAVNGLQWTGWCCTKSVAHVYTSMQLMRILWKVPSDFWCTIGICWQSYQCRMSFAKRNTLCLTSEFKPWNQSNETSFYCSNKSTSNKYLIGFEPFRHLIHSYWNCPFPGIAERFWMFLGKYSSVGYSMDLHSIFLHFKMEIQFSVLIKWNHGIHWLVILTVQWIWAIRMVLMLSTCILYKENIHKYGIS